MIVVAPEALLAQRADASYTTEQVSAAWADAWRAFRAELARPEVDTVCVLCGVPGSGKSSWCAEQGILDNVVAFDAVHAERGRRVSIAKRITDAGKRPVAIHVVAPLSLCVARNAARPPGRQVAEAYLRRAWQELHLRPVMRDEGWDEIVIVPGSKVRMDRRTSEEADRKAGRVAFRWRTQGDDRVRPEHARRHGRLFAWGYLPDDGAPGDAFGCRCWAEYVADSDVIETVDGELRARPLTIPKWARKR